MTDLKSISLAVRAKAKQYSSIAGVAAAFAFSVVMNIDAVLAPISLSLLLFILPCLLMMAFCMENVKGRQGGGSRSLAGTGHKGPVVARVISNIEGAKLDA